MSTPAPSASATPAPGAWAPLGQPTFRALWLAILAGNIGTWMHDVAAAWVMTELTGSPLMVAAVQAATTLPVVLLALAAGALADIVDRRRYLIVAQLWMAGVAALLAVLAQAGQVGPWTLLALTFALGVGAAMAMPAQAATTPELVPRAMLAPAVALNSVGMNIARSIGPALGGLVVARLGASWAFALNAVSFVAVLVVLWRWRRTPAPSKLPAETFGGALRAGLRYAGQATALRAVLVKAACFFVFASALTALMPVIVRRDLGAGPGTFGLLLGCVGIGAIAGAMLLPRLRGRVDRDTLVLAASLLYAACMPAVATFEHLALLCPVMLLAGVAWIAVLSSLQVAAQTAVPAWVRARALSLYIVVFSLGMAGGALIWGALAQRHGSDLALYLAAAGTALAALFARRFRLGGTDTLDLAPSAHWPEPLLTEPVDGERGPVLVTVEYRIDAADRDTFLHAMRELGRSRRRDGAVQWGVLEDTAQPGTHLEYFLVPSWLEHLRQHARVTGEERRLQETLRALHRGDTAPAVRHFVAGSAHDLAKPGPGHDDI
ncbi:MAG TPA: MFS transporter [Dokdonella sp.]|uniref:MFS transporter n=1 Tax=Dokdonella sp. TaxID=2291710 RepID=UPI002B6DAAAC|nr:MFS transporter [Dokdonella sp.]HUD41691.1 MFS transporter [Dokdonella sp.]